VSAHRAVPLRWDWLRPSIIVPYVPTIGPVHPDTLGEQVFVDVIAVAATGQVLGCDKDSRWFKATSETVLVDAIAQCPDQTLVPTLSCRGAGIVSVYLYGSAVDGHRAGREAPRGQSGRRRPDRMVRRA
jgi:hypothetical protein